MKRLTKHILSLLRLYDSVELPGLGIFYLEYVPANYNRDASTFFPPHHVVSFRESVSEFTNCNDFGNTFWDCRLLDSYIKKENISPEEARKLMDEDLSDFRNYLSFGGCPVLKEFEFINAPLPRIVATSRTEASSMVPLNAQSHLEMRKEQPQDSHFRNPNYFYIPIHKKVAKIAACFLLVVAVGLATLIPVGHSVNSTSTASIVPMSVGAPQTSNTAAEPVVKQLEEFDSKEMLMPGLTFDSIPQENQTSDYTAVSPHDKYYVVVAAFKTQKEADKFIESNKGDKARFSLIKNKSFFMVAAFSSSDKGDLDASLPLIRSHFPDAWTFTMK